MIEQCTQMMQGMGGMMSGMMGGGMMGGMMLPMFLGLLLVVSLVTLMIVLFVRGRQDTHGSQGSNPLLILQERFARGEIDVEEYQQRRGILLDQS